MCKLLLLTKRLEGSVYCTSMEETSTYNVISLDVLGQSVQGIFECINLCWDCRITTLVKLQCPVALFLPMQYGAAFSCL